MTFKDKIFGICKSFFYVTLGLVIGCVLAYYVMQVYLQRSFDTDDIRALDILYEARLNLEDRAAQKIEVSHENSNGKSGSAMKITSSDDDEAAAP